MNPLIIPANINDLSPFEQVLLFHRYGDIVFPLDPPAKGKNGKTPIKSVKKRPTAPNEHDLYHQFGNGNNYNVGVYPAKGHVIVNLDAADKDRTHVDAFLNSRSELANVPRVQTGKGYHLHFLSAEPPRTQHKPNIAP